MEVGKEGRIKGKNEGKEKEEEGESETERWISFLNTNVFMKTHAHDII